MLKDSRLLFKSWLKNPRHIGAIVVSSPELAAAMARQIPSHPKGYVVELGGGTGAVTRAILKAGIDPDRLVVVERDRALFDHLVKRFPGVRVLLGDAMHLNALLKRHDIHPVSAIVSSLPLLSMKKSVQYRIGAQAFASLEADAPLIQFTYGLFSPLPKSRLGILGQVAERVLQNLPPASIWCYRRASALKLDNAA
jgi:phosphatidylethanolamine/phosphatidyl-N-methylethanolamine N-methyltransferase